MVLLMYMTFLAAVAVNVIGMKLTDQEIYKWYRNRQERTHKKWASETEENRRSIAVQLFAKGPQYCRTIFKDSTMMVKLEKCVAAAVGEDIVENLIKICDKDKNGKWTVGHIKNVSQEEIDKMGTLFSSWYVNAVGTLKIPTTSNVEDEEEDIFQDCEEWFSGKNDDESSSSSSNH